MMSPVTLTTSRTTKLNVSAMNRSPAASTATPAGIVQLGGGRGPVVAAVTEGTVAGDGDDVAGRLDDLADHVVARVGDEQVARGVDGDTGGEAQLGVGGGSVVAAVTVGVPLPATVMMSPVALTTSRITLLPVSAMNRSPAASTATP